MKLTFLTFFSFFILLIISVKAQKSVSYTLVIHGGAGNITRANLPPDIAAQYEAKLTEVLNMVIPFLKPAAQASMPWKPAYA